MEISRREAARMLAEELLTDIELARLAAPEVVKKVSRLARLLDDTEASEWLSFELHGYPRPLTREAVQAARRSNRKARPEPDQETPGDRYFTTSISRLQADVDARRLQLQAAHDVSVSVTSANPNQHVFASPGNAGERGRVSAFIAEQQGLLGAIMGAMHAYVVEREIELRFGDAMEDAFTAVRNEVDAKIATLVPAAATKLAAAFESAASGNPEQWANAASVCRRLLKAVADEIRPPGAAVEGRTMSDDKYINRLIDWISKQSIGDTARDMIASDLEDFGKRIDALDGAGHKGAHAEVSRYEASRAITGAYLLIGDILRLWVPPGAAVDDSSSVEVDSSDAPEP